MGGSASAGQRGWKEILSGGGAELIKCILPRICINASAKVDFSYMLFSVGFPIKVPMQSLPFFENVRHRPTNLYSSQTYAHT